MSITFLHGDCRTVLATLPPASAQMCVTSPPYWQLRRYTDDPAEIGQEPTYQAYIEALVDVFDQVRRVLCDDGTLWLNIADCYAGGGRGGGGSYAAQGRTHSKGFSTHKCGLPVKSLIGLPWRIAFALQDAGWLLRTEIVWEKPNCMPESVADRPTRSHEYVFLFAKQSQYYYNADAIKEPAVNGDPAAPRGSRGAATPNAGRRDKQGASGLRRYTGFNERWEARIEPLTHRNARTVWRIPTRGLPDEHYAPYPDELPRRCILAGSRPGDTVLDPFVGSGTAARVCEVLGRDCIGIDLGYAELQERRTDGIQIEMEAYL